MPSAARARAAVSPPTRLPQLPPLPAAPLVAARRPTLNHRHWFFKPRAEEPAAEETGDEDYGRRATKTVTGGEVFMTSHPSQSGVDLDLVVARRRPPVSDEGVARTLWTSKVSSRSGSPTRSGTPSVVGGVHARPSRYGRPLARRCTAALRTRLKMTLQLL